MNIIKFKLDKCPNSKTNATTYNTYFRGRYCYAIHADHLVLMKPDNDSYSYYQYVKDNDVDVYNYELIDESVLDSQLAEEGISKLLIKSYSYIPNDPILDSDNNIVKYIKIETPGITQEQYIQFEKEHDHNVVVGLFQQNVPQLSLNDWMAYVDKSESPMYENLEFYNKRNAEVDAMNDIPAHLLQRYRAMVSAFIYNGVQNGALDICDKKKSLLEYYINDMNNDTIGVIKMMQNNISSQNNCGCASNINTLNSTSLLASSSCGCSCQSNGAFTTNISSINGLTSIVSGCDILKEYRAMMKLYMMNVFGDIDFWKYITEKYKVAIDKIVDYTRALAGSGLSIFTSGTKLDLNYGCGTASRTNNKQYLAFANDLNNIADAFEMILKEDYSKINFIKTQLTLFVNYYEYLQWDKYTVSVFEENWD